MNCEWCGNVIDSWYLKYKGKVFCECNDNACIKNYLYEEHDEEIGEDRVVDDDYNMNEVDYVDFMEQRGFE